MSGVNAISSSNNGLYGESGTGNGVRGNHTATSGTGSGVVGSTDSTDPGSAGVTGKNFAGGPAVQALVGAGNLVPPLAVNSNAKVANLNADLLDGLGAAAFWQLGGNAGTNPGSDFLGTSDNQALVLKVNGQRALRLEPNATGPNVIGGFSGNSVTPGAVAATIAGGGTGGIPNTVSGNGGSVGGGGGGDFNTASGSYSVVVGGGLHNTASGFNSAVGGGQGNTAGGSWSAVAGGQQNTTGSDNSAVAGGNRNTASGYASTVAGGQDNTASGNFSLAAGRQAKATEAGSFVWGDNTNADLTSPAVNTFTVRASGGIWLGTCGVRKYDLAAKGAGPDGGRVYAPHSVRTTWGLLKTAAPRTRFATAERAWLVYRGANCRSRTDAVKAGSLAALASADCAADMNRQHVRELGRFEADIRKR